ncbi:hypothetical protein GIB67_012813 [Kingdonia uniflora]|uniref:EF-hand domain-containing protein n=1 Tax=Kingdonia uniflora TaxID=39325 RepID=A0A7J7NFF1_9MAGN|nr:hypothetical protein GIB67_012813 [Kingdonia uniflora]
MGSRPSQNYAPSAPSLPQNYGQQQQPPKPSSSYNPNGQHLNYGQQQQQQQQPSSSYGSGYGYPYPAAAPSYGPQFPLGTDVETIRSFQMVDKDRSGFIDVRELQEALSFGYQRFGIGTIRMVMFFFKSGSGDSSKIGPNEFAALWSCLGQWRAIFERFDRDRSGKIDSMELRDALYSLGYAVPSSVLQVLMSRYDDGRGRRGELNFDSFVECGMIVKVSHIISPKHKLFIIQLLW